MDDIASQTVLILAKSSKQGDQAHTYIVILDYSLIDWMIDEQTLNKKLKQLHVTNQSF